MIKLSGTIIRENIRVTTLNASRPRRRRSPSFWLLLIPAALFGLFLLRIAT